MLKLPLSIIYAMVAVNVTAFAIVLQLDMLFFNMPALKIIAWVLTIGSWAMVYAKRNKFIILF